MQFLLNQCKSNEYRQELKFSFPHADRRILEQRIKRNSALFSQIFYPRWVNSLYYDTPGLSAYYGSINGVSPRIKVRIRWYGDIFGKIHPALEFKIKQANKNVKVTYSLNSIEITPKITLPLLEERILTNKLLPVEIKDILKLLKPTLVTRYWRSYYRSQDKEFRITVDSRLETMSLLRCRTFLQIKPVLDGSIIVELKYRDGHKEASRVIQDFSSHFKLMRMSKYTTGLEW